MSRDKCYNCDAYVPEGRQICHACERAAKLGSLDNTAEGVIRKNRPAIIRAAKARTSKEADLLAVQEIASFGLAHLLMQFHANGGEAPTDGMKNYLIRAIAQTRVLVERLAIIHCSTERDADAYRFHLEQAARQADPGRR